MKLVNLTEEELQFLRGYVNTQLKSIERRIENLQQNKKLTDKQKDLLEGLKKSKEFKQNLLKKLEENKFENNSKLI